ncbi:flagellar basal-body rod protein FlgG [Escherichia coli]|uniref:Flagellar basal-body rod protein FlgG n=1 Tax=Escherichia coli TaxID=562 RepID=A0A376ZZ27_ECOLX|nr:flagellar basal-body rod protein FlgG [Escherichia coli]
MRLSITIGRDGVVSVTQQGQAAPVQVGQLNLTTFMNDTGLESIGENLLHRNAILWCTERKHAGPERRGTAVSRVC